MSGVDWQLDTGRDDQSRGDIVTLSIFAKVQTLHDIDFNSDILTFFIFINIEKTTQYFSNLFFGDGWYVIRLYEYQKTSFLKIFALSCFTIWR